MPTPTNRPFLANFLAGFRAHSALSKPHPSSNNTSSTSSSPSSFNSLVTSQARSLATAAASQAQKPTTTGTTSSSSATHSNNNSTSTTTTSVQANLSHHSRPVAPGANSPAAAAVVARSPPTSTGNGFQHRVSPQHRRGSDSSSDGGFRDALGGEKWYIGGRTTGGEERFYRLGMVKKERSGDRLSLDRLSL